MTVSPQFTRRAVLGGSLGIGAGVAMAGCRTERNTPPEGETGEAAERPSYIKFDGPVPDLVGDGAVGIPDGFLSYPDPPVSTGQVPLEVSAPFTMMMQRNPSTTPRSNNQWWQRLEADLGAELQVSAVEHPVHRQVSRPQCRASRSAS